MRRRIRMLFRSGYFQVQKEICIQKDFIKFISRKLFQSLKNLQSARQWNLYQFCIFDPFINTFAIINCYLRQFYFTVFVKLALDQLLKIIEIQNYYLNGQILYVEVQGQRLLKPFKEYRYNHILDYWNLGVLLYHLQNLELPFKVKTPYQMYQAILNSKVEFLQCIKIDILIILRPEKSLIKQLLNINKSIESNQNKGENFLIHTRRMGDGFSIVLKQFIYLKLLGSILYLNEFKSKFEKKYTKIAI
ncbi:unnamed protein product (macronuclear) [Paramecium tetraurelia]|uniref:Protein kinase domain-containing protein n=1 Tax=Paramecium tetraurelia TaxID=5888 RepID=A0BMN0_PARTE|nr:uncharacterized protein GSPATT00030433001 [Paramecium tetraurelia]CAK59797.1 unnamed protein product [Paramecium tetraurelia]|eukprot:XP_001427195.1 hypothetical protein (macronuclear) [Paramecium tetraurelia strain d4-2]